MGGLTFDWLQQDSYFSGGLSDVPRRAQGLLGQRAACFVVRNQPVEFPCRLLRRLATYAGCDLNVQLSAYDDSLLSLPPEPVAAELIWPDWMRVPDTELQVLLDGIGARPGEAPTTLVLPAAGARLDQVRDWAAERGVATLAFPPAAGEASAAVRRFSGSSLDSHAQLAIARHLLLEWLLPALLPPLKLLVVDLDNTVYSGVLAEDGVSRLTVTAAQREVSMLIDSLAAGGVLVAAVSRNSQTDVDALLRDWPPGLFRQENLVAAIGTDQNKGHAMRDLIDRFQTVPESIAFLDDNPGEIRAACTVLPDLWPIVASDQPATRRLLSAQHARSRVLIPGAGRARRADAAAQDARLTVRADSATADELHRSLQTRLIVRPATAEDLPRVSELLERTNQFNVSLRRTSLASLVAKQGLPDRVVVLAELRDRFADSGVIAVLLTRRRETVLHIEELAISCRALGRHLETPIVAALLECAGAIDQHVEVQPVAGPRNGPALAWLASVSRGPADTEGLVRLDVVSLLAEAAQLKFIHVRDTSDKEEMNDD